MRRRALLYLSRTLQLPSRLLLDSLLWHLAHIGYLLPVCRFSGLCCSNRVPISTLLLSLFYTASHSQGQRPLRRPCRAAPRKSRTAEWSFSGREYGQGYLPGLQRSGLETPHSKNWELSDSSSYPALH
ncbi:hypothetical protein N658DRAFT_167812 [Parathielavia hyrcaniae]|uniref:Uncharacterized protein n=1 Tax=Parathielavia hyrcaniae TaxID=113614 RepID=A0AAN6SZM5_9PEZI|nr:hypothetical protein N658DRAFT_167812 [Parathielavia hyrcaniae]